MKKINNKLFILGLILVITGCSGGDSDLAKTGLKGDISNITIYHFEAVHKNDNWEKGRPLSNGHRIMQYDAGGAYVKSFALTHEGDTLGYTIVRKENGETVEEVFHSLFNGRSTRTIMERVDERQVNFEVWEGETLYFEGASYYDSRGRLVSQVRVVEDREVMNHFVYDKGLMVKSFQEELNGEISGTQLYEYTEFDEKGNWTKRLVYPTEDRIVPEMITTRVYEYR